MNPAVRRFYGVFGGVVLIIAALVLFFSFTLPAFGEIQKLRGERQSLLLLVTEQRAAIANVERLLSEFDSVTGVADNISLVLPGEQEVPGIVNQLNGVANLNDVFITALNIEVLPVQSTGETAVIEPVGVVRVTLSLRGTYENVRGFVEMLETNIRVIDVAALTVDGGAETSNVLDYEFVLDTYYQP